MEWHQSLLYLLSKESAKKDENDLSLSRTEQLASLLIFDNAKPHRSLHGSHSTVAGTQLSASSSINDEELSVMFEEVDLYSDDNAELHQSFPVTKARRLRRRRRRPPKLEEQNDADGRNDVTGDLLACWSNSDSTIDYNCLDDMLREENSQTASARENVPQPSRRRSFEIATVVFSVDDLQESMDQEGEIRSDRNFGIGGIPPDFEAMLPPR